MNWLPADPDINACCKHHFFNYIEYEGKHDMHFISFRLFTNGCVKARHIFLRPSSFFF